MKLNGNRRQFLKRAAAVAVAAQARRVWGAPAIGAVAAPETMPVSNRAPLAQNAFNLLPLGSIRPVGWLRAQLQIQADGLSGHLDEVWADVGPTSAWLGGKGEAFERGPYYVDGLLPLAYLLNDAALKAKAQKFVDWTLENQQPSGQIGPLFGNSADHPVPKATEDWWPRMVMLKVLTQYYEATGDPRVIPVMTRYFHYQLATLPARPLVDWGRFRWQDNVLSVLWLYNRTGDAKLLALARLLHQQGWDWQAQFADFKATIPQTPAMFKATGGGLAPLALSTHGVNNGQAIKASPVWSLVTDRPADRAALAVQLAALDRYHGLPNGMFTCDEHLAGRNPSQGSELCTVVETMFSLEQSLAILGEATLGDRLERIAYNALPGTLTDDMWAHQYNQQANQIECGHIQPWLSDGPESNLFGLAPNFGCCTANYHQGWPKLTSSLWMASADGGLAAAVYAPCVVDTTAGGTRVRLTVETEYPFRDLVRVAVDPQGQARFPLHLRIPEWAAGATLFVNGEPAPAPLPASFARVERTWKAGDVIELRLPMVPRVSRWFNNSLALSRGPLVFSYAVPARWAKFREHGPASDWEIYPQGEWNYGLAIDEETARDLHVEEHPLGLRPFSQESAAVRLTVPARKVAWQAKGGVADALPPSPVGSDGPLEQITLIPYAAAKLRITAFPQVEREAKHASA